MIKNRFVPLGALSGLIIIGGIIFAVLVGVAFNQIKDKEPSRSGYNRVSSAVNFPFWVFGFMYIIPGMISLGAAFVQNKCMYIVALVFDILFVIGTASVIVVLGLTTYLSILTCSYSYITCDYTSPQAFFIGIFVVGSISGIFLFIAFILCCYYTCCANTISTPGVVVQSGPQINIAVSQASQQQNSQLNPNPMNTVPPYGAPQYGQNGYGAPQYGQNGYGAPQYGQNGYGAPNGQIGYGTPNGQNSYGAPNGQIGYGAPNGQNSYGAPNGQISYGAPNEQNTFHAFGAPNGQNGSGAHNGQNAHSGHQQNAPSTDVASPADVHLLQDRTKNNN